MFVLFSDTTKLDLVATGAAICAIRVLSITDCSGTVGRLETDHSLDLGNVVPSLSTLLFLYIVHTLTHLGASTNDVVELVTEEASTNPDHGDTDGRDVANAHEEEEDGLLTTIGSTDVDCDETGDGHSRDADKEAVDEVDVGLAIASVEDSGSDEGCEGEDENVNSEEVEVLAAPSSHRLEFRAGCGSALTTCNAARHVGGQRRAVDTNESMNAV